MLQVFRSVGRPQKHRNNKTRLESGGTWSCFAKEHTFLCFSFLELGIRKCWPCRHLLDTFNISDWNFRCRTSRNNEQADEKYLFRAGFLEQILDKQWSVAIEDISLRPQEKKCGYGKDSIWRNQLQACVNEECNQYTSYSLSLSSVSVWWDLRRIPTSLILTSRCASATALSNKTNHLCCIVLCQDGCTCWNGWIPHPKLADESIQDNETRFEFLY